MSHDELDIEDIDAAESLLESAESAATAPDEWIAKTLVDVARFFSVHVQTAKSWRAESPPMPGREGHWPLAEIVRWRHAKLSHSELSDGLKQQQLERTRVQVEQQKLDLAKDRGELIEREEVSRDLSIILARAKNRLLAIGTEVATAAPESLKVVAKQIVDDRVALALKELVDSLDSDPPGQQAKSDENTKAAG